MILKYPKLLNNPWLKEDCFIGVYSNPYEVYQVTSIVQNNGVKIKYKPYCGLISLQQIYYIPNNFVYYEGNKFYIKEQFDKYFQKNKDKLYLKYESGIAQCNLCKKQFEIIDYCGNGSYFCNTCKNIKKQISIQNIKKQIDINQPINYSDSILQLINLFSQICYEKMNDVQKIEKFLSIAIKIIYINKYSFNFNMLTDRTIVNYNICKLKDSVFCYLGQCFVSLHDGTKKDKYTAFITNEMFFVIKDFIALKNKSF